MKNNKKIVKVVIFIFAVLVTLVSLGAFCHIHSYPLDTDDCQLCYLIENFKSVTFALVYALVVYFSFHLLMVLEDLALPKSNLNVDFVRAPPII